MQQVFSVLCNQLLRLRGFPPCQTVECEQFHRDKTDPSFTGLMNDMYMRWRVIVEVDPNIETASSQHCRHRTVIAGEGALVDLKDRVPRTPCLRRTESTKSCGVTKHLGGHTPVCTCAV